MTALNSSVSESHEESGRASAPSLCSPHSAQKSKIHSPPNIFAVLA